MIITKINVYGHTVIFIVGKHCRQKKAEEACKRRNRDNAFVLQFSHTKKCDRINFFR